MLNRNYDVDLTEFNKLAEMLIKAHIPHSNKPMGDWCGNGRQIILYKEPEFKNRLADVICNYGSYGKEKGLLEIRGALTQEESELDSVLGYLTAEEVFKRFKYCYEHQTNIYSEE